MRILVTGGFGNVGMSAVRALLGSDHEVCVFEHPSAQKRRQRRLRDLLREARGRIRVYYGEIDDEEALARAMTGVWSDGPDAVIHLAGVIPPLANRAPEIAQRINIGGMRSLLNVCATMPRLPRIVFASSVALYGDRLANPWISSDDMLMPNDTYGKTKLECESLLRRSSFEWVILRLSYVVSADWLPFDPVLFEVPPSTHFEVVHTEDAGRAFASACAVRDIRAQALNIGGGGSCRTTYRAYLDRLMRCFGLGSASFLQDGLFAKGNFHCGWFADSDDAESTLRFRSKSLEDYYSEVAWRMRWVRPCGSMARWAVKPWIRSLSPYREAIRLSHSRQLA